MIISRKAVLKHLVPASVSGLILLYLALSFETDALLASMTSFSVETVLAVIVILIGNILVVSLRLWRVLRHFGIAQSYVTALRANVAGLVSSLFMFALAGAIVGRRVSLRAAGVGVSTIALLTTYERIVIAAVGAGLCALGGGVLFGGQALHGIFVQLPLWQIAGTLVLAVAIGVLVARSDYELALLRRLVSSAVAARVGAIAGYTLVGQAISLVAYAVAMHGLGVDADLFSILAAAAIVSFAASLPLSVNGWGIREVAAIYAFGHLDVPAADAVAVSVLFGLCSTAVVLIAAPVLLIGDRKQATAQHTTQLKQADVGSVDALQRMSAMLLAYAATILVFFQLHATVSGSLITVNLADPFAIIGLTMVLVTWLSTRQSSVRFGAATWIWLAAVLVVLLAGFLIGVTRFGVTAWALNNRLVGWGVILGYVSLGAMLVGAWGQHGLRRFAELTLTTAAAVVIAVFVVSQIDRVTDAQLFYESNFQGFSANRNSFAMQLCIALCCGIAVSPLRRRPLDRAVWFILIAIVLYGLWRTESKTGVAVGGIILLFSYGFRIGDRRMLTGIIGIGAIYAVYRSARGLMDPIVTRGDTWWDNLVASAGGFNPEALFERWFSVEQGLALWLGYPIFGAGLGAFMHRVTTQNAQELVIHSTPAWILAEFGIAGFAIVFALPAFWFLSLLRRRRKVVPRTAMVLTTGLVFGLFGLMHDVAYQRLFWLAMGVGLGAFALGAVRRAAPIVPFDRPIKVLHVITTLNRGGAETMLLELLRHRDGGMRPIVASLASDGVLSDAVRETGTPLLELGFRRNLPNPAGLLRLILLIRREKPDVIQGWMYHGDIVGLLALMLSGRRRKTRLYWGIRCSDMDLSRYGVVLRLIVRLCAVLSALTDGVIANSHVGRSAHLSLGYRPPRFDVVHNGLNLEKFRPNVEDRGEVRRELGLSDDVRVLIHVARVDPMKDHDRLLACAARVPDLHLVMVGQGTDQLPAQDRVLALGLRSDVPRLLRAADGVVLSSAFGEGFPNALAEGMASGLVPIATDVGDAAVLVDGAGWVVPPCDSEALISAMTAFVNLTDAELRSMQGAARVAIARRFTVGLTQDRFLAIYQSATPAPETPDLVMTDKGISEEKGR